MKTHMIQKRDLLMAINEILKTKTYYTIADIILYFAAQDIHVTRKDIIRMLVMIIDGDRISE